MNAESLLAVQLSDFSPIDSLPPSVLGGGVYICMDANEAPLYVGQTGLFHQRISEHRRSKKWWREVKDVLVYPLKDPQERLVVETGLILRLRPRHNRWIKIQLSDEGRKIQEIQWLSSHKKSPKSRSKKK